MTGDRGHEPPAPRASPTDEELAAMLRGRAARADLGGLQALARAVASVPGSQARGVRLGHQLRVRRTWLPIAAAALVVVALVGGSMLGGAIDPSEPDGSAAESQTPSATGDPGEIRAITPEELEAGMARDRDALAGRTFAVEGRLIWPPDMVTCAAILPECFPRVLAGAEGVAVIPARPAVGADWLPPEEFSDRFGVAGILALRVPAVGSAASRDEPLEYLGRIAPGFSDLASAHAELPDLASWDGAELVAVDATLTAFDVPCLPTASPPPEAERPSCRIDWLRDPALGALPAGMPLDAVGLVVQPGAYEAFAPGPIETVGDAYAPLVRATYLVREGVGSGCDTVPDWRCSGAAVPRWEVVGRLDPWPLGESGPTTPTPTPTPEPPVEPAGQLVEAIPAEALVAALQADRAALVGRTYAVFGQVARDPGLECLDGSDPVACPGITFGDVGSLFVRIEPVGDVGPGPWDPDAAALFGVHAIRVTAEDQAGIGPVLEYLGPIEPAGPELGPTAWSVEALLATGVLSGPELYPIAGWLVRDAVHTCPSPVPSRGCPDAWITPERYQPIQPGGGSVAPVGAIPVQPDAYERFAPDPDADPPGVQPRFGTYLVQRVQLSCGPNTDCFPPEGWMIRERLAPLPAEPSPVEPPPVGLKTLASPELAKLLDGARLADLGGYVFVFDGRISPDPVVLCIAGPRPPDCPPLILLPWNGRQTVLTWDPAAPPDWDLLQPVTGRFVLRITGDVLGSSETVVFRYLGRP